MSSETAGNEGVEYPRSSWLPSSDPLDQSLELVVWLARKKASNAAMELEQINVFRKRWQERYGLLDTDVDHVKWRSMRWELAAALKIPEQTIDHKLSFARHLVETFPTTLSKMKSGLLSEQHADILVFNLCGLPADERSALEAKLLPYAETLTVGKFKAKVRKQIELRKPEEMDARYEEALKEREIWVEPLPDGMAVLCNKMDAVDAHAAFNLMTAQAAALKVEGEERTNRQLASDVMRDMLLDDQAQLSAVEPGHVLRDVKPRHRGIVPTVYATVPVFSMMGRSIEPAHLEGYGPISMKAAAKIAGAASGFIRILTDPHTGVPISVGRERYRPPAEMRAEIIRQDVKCRAVGCNRRAEECDLDHTVPASVGGETALSNLAALCPNHHEEKHNGGWAVVQLEGRRLRWTSPLGRTYETEPESGDSVFSNPASAIDESWFQPGDEEDDSISGTPSVGN